MGAWTAARVAQFMQRARRARAAANQHRTGLVADEYHKGTIRPTLLAHEKRAAKASTVIKELDSGVLELGIDAAA